MPDEPQFRDDVLAPDSAIPRLGLTSTFGVHFVTITETVCLDGTFESTMPITCDGRPLPATARMSEIQI